jgi:hypothetical protein
MHVLLALLEILVLFVAAAKILAVKVGTSIDLPHLPCRPASLVLADWFVPSSIALSC